MLKIVAVRESSSAEQAGLKRGDLLVSVAGRQVRDAIDFMYYADRESIKATARRKAGMFSVKLKRNGQGRFGLRFEALRPRTCPNKCVFCFIDQLPQGLRKSLYVKDEDYRFSFLYGNFITMTSLRGSELDRIVDQRLSPLYVSVHCTDPAVRAAMLGLKGDSGIRRADLFPKLDRLREGRVEVHAQIVLCPGLNDGHHLEKTVSDLSGFFPTVRSVALVPVGLSRHRRGLPALRPVGKRGAERALDLVRKWQLKSLREWGTRFVFAADELYLLTGSSVPRAQEYEGYPQVENGVGLVRMFLEESASLRRRIRERAGRSTARVLTGKLAEAVCREALGTEGTRVLGVPNRLLGESVSVAGLLAGSDILKAMRRLEPGEVAVIPETCLNDDGLLLDGMTPGQLQQASGHEVIVERTGYGQSGGRYRGQAERGEVHAFQ